MDQEHAAAEIQVGRACCPSLELQGLVPSTLWRIISITMCFTCKLHILLSFGIKSLFVNTLASIQILRQLSYYNLLGSTFYQCTSWHKPLLLLIKLLRLYIYLAILLWPWIPQGDYLLHQELFTLSCSKLFALLISFSVLVTNFICSHLKSQPFILFLTTHLRTRVTFVVSPLLECCLDLNRFKC